MAAYPSNNGAHDQPSGCLPNPQLSTAAQLLSSLGQLPFQLNTASQPTVWQPGPGCNYTGPQPTQTMTAAQLPCSSAQLPFQLSTASQSTVWQPGPGCNYTEPQPTQTIDPSLSMSGWQPSPPSGPRAPLGSKEVLKVLKSLSLKNLKKFSYNKLKEATENFAYEIGDGAFGNVYRAVIGDITVAVKKLKTCQISDQFISEVKFLTKYKHENVLPLLGYSVTKPAHCLVYEYMVNGSLQDRLLCKGNTPPISWNTRLTIAYGSALGINHLHTFGEKPVVHRDIKSANILLDENFFPKVGDFGLVRSGDNSWTENVCGTPIYMAPEALNGHVTVKFDTYSFGVVLLELLTGLRPYDIIREHENWASYIENNDIRRMLDPKTNWNPDVGEELHRVAEKCLTVSMHDRPALSEVLEDLEECLSYVE